MIKLFQPYVCDEAVANVMRVLNGTQLAQGPEVDLFEKEFAKQFGFEEWQVVSLNSGTAALELAYELCDLNVGDHVISPVLTCTATNIPLVRRGVDVSFADVDGKKTLNTCPADVSDKIQANTKAIVYVHFGGSSFGLHDIEDLAEESGIDLICDAAQALGSTLSKVARFSCVSLQAIKSLTAGDGGVLICRDQEDATKARKLRWFGYDRDLKKKMGDCDLDLAGYKMHMNDINAAIARGNLSKWMKIWGHRKNINRTYERFGRGKGFISGIWNPQVVGIPFEPMRRKASDVGFEIGQYHYRNDKYSLFKNVKSTCPNMDAVGDKYFMLPCHMGVSVQDAERLAKIIWEN